MLSIATVFATLLGSFTPEAAAQEAQLQDLYANVRLFGPQWVVNANGTVTVVYDLKNVSFRRLVLPQTKRGNTLGYFAGSRQQWIERVGGGPIPPLDQAKNGRRGWQYGFGGTLIVTNGVLDPGQALHFQETFRTAGFPPGRYNFIIEYLTLKDQAILSHVVTFNVP
jgi:hypothetical protein